MPAARGKLVGRVLSLRPPGSVRRPRGQPVDNLEIWRSARLLIEQRGEDAVLFAAQRADELLDGGDHLGCSVWIAIGRAIKDLQRENT